MLSSRAQDVSDCNCGLVQFYDGDMWCRRLHGIVFSRDIVYSPLLCNLNLNATNTAVGGEGLTVYILKSLFL